MIVDSHVHIKGGDYYRRQFDPDDTLRMLDRAGIDKACILSMCLPSWESNELILNAYRGREDRFIPYAHALPEEGDIAHEAFRGAVEDWGFQGLKLHCGEVRGEMTPELFIPFFEQAVDLKVPVLIDCINRPELLTRIAEAVPEAKIIAAHLGSFDDAAMVNRFISICRSHPNVWLDTAYSSVPWKIPDAVRYCGAEKIIFGSDGGAGYYPSSIDLAKLMAYDLTDDELALILSANIMNLLGM